MLSAYLLEPATWIAVLIPALITLWALLSSPLSPSQWRAWGISTVLAMLCARWDISEDVHQLFIIPVVLFWIAGSLYRGSYWAGRQAFAAAFTSLWVVDMAQAAIQHSKGTLGDGAFYAGVGGAGAQDGLILFPLLAWAVTRYIRWRQQAQAGRGLSVA
jgi:hypothetical protein